MNTKFEAFKLRSEIRRSGIKYEFNRFDRNDFGELTNEAKVVGTLSGIYHENTHGISAIEIYMVETTQIRSKKIPMILCLHEDVAALNLMIGDEVIINKKKFKVIGIINIQEWNIIADISLEVIDDGVNIEL